MPTTLALHQLSVIAISLLQEDTSSDFSDLGKKLLVGFVLAVVVAVAFTFIKLRLRDKKPPAEFISITSFQKKDEPSKVTRD
jgi:FtsH-binding integral membrane protein